LGQQNKSRRKGAQMTEEERPKFCEFRSFSHEQVLRIFIGG
jgi:hypothetical protein